MNFDTHVTSGVCYLEKKKKEKFLHIMCLHSRSAGRPSRDGVLAMRESTLKLIFSQ